MVYNVFPESKLKCCSITTVCKYYQKKYTNHFHLIHNLEAIVLRGRHVSFTQSSPPTSPSTRSLSFAKIIASKILVSMSEELVTPLTVHQPTQIALPSQQLAKGAIPTPGESAHHGSIPQYPVFQTTYTKELSHSLISQARCRTDDFLISSTAHHELNSHLAAQWRLLKAIAKSFSKLCSILLLSKNNPLRRWAPSFNTTKINRRGKWSEACYEWLPAPSISRYSMRASQSTSP